MEYNPQKEKRLFGSSGIRGDATELFTDQFCFDLGRAFAIFLARHEQRGSIAIGCDPRESSPRIMKSLASGMVFELREVLDQGIVPIPSLNYILKKDKSIVGSVMISGSHIKADLNGAKFFAFGKEILKEQEEEITDIYYQVKSKVEYRDMSDKLVSDGRAKSFYIEYLISKAKLSIEKLRIVVDPGGGAQSEVIPEVLGRLDLDVVSINTSITENFLARDTEVDNDFDNLKIEVVRNKADLGVGYDSDGDRVVFIDEKGTFIPGDYTGTLIARDISDQNIVTPINTSLVIEKIGKNVLRTKVGSPYVVQKMEEVKSKFGFEANGGCIFDDMHTRDGGRTTIEILNILFSQKISMSSLVSGLPRFYIRRNKIEYPLDRKSDILEKAKTEFKGIRSDETDGLKIWIDENSWILFRSSANAAEFRVFAESDNEVKADDLLQKGLELVRQVIK